MPYIPHTQNDVTAMLTAIGVTDVNELFDEIPDDLRCGVLANMPSQLTEMDVKRLMRQRAVATQELTCFAGAGAYQHHIPAIIWDIVTRGEFYSAYTPYQAEASQGTLQLLYEFQTMMANLLGMEASNASLYDGASALAEAVLMAVRLRKVKRVLLPATVHPIYRQVVHTIVKNQGIELDILPYQQEQGVISLSELPEICDKEIAALVIPQPNFFGQLESVDELTDWAHSRGLLVIGVVNPLAMALLSPPGAWGQQGADIVCGEGQPLGIPLSSGGPYFGFMCCKKRDIRQLPGRIVGRTVDLEGKPGYTLTLQAREQHIRRSKATSNICTNQGLMVAAATIYLALLGATGLMQTAKVCHFNTLKLVEKLTHLPGVARIFTGPYFHEVALRLPIPVAEVLQQLAMENMLGGYDLTTYYPQLGHGLLVCATELRTDAEIEKFVEKLRGILDCH